MGFSRVVFAALLVFAVHLRAQPATSQMLTNVAYVAKGTADQTMDVYWAPKATSTVLFIHGGSLQEVGERRSSVTYRDVCKPFIGAGINCATMDYRLAPTHTWPAMPDDVASAVAKLRALITQRGGDPKQIFLFGHSSGCHLAAIVGTNPEFLQRVGLSLSDVAGIIPMGCTLDRDDVAIRKIGVETIRAAFARDKSDADTYGTAENWLSANPASYLSEKTPPMLVVLSKAERFMPAILEQGARVVRRLLEMKRPADLIIVPGRHMSSIAAIVNANDPGFAAIKSFIEHPLMAAPSN